MEYIYFISVNDLKDRSPIPEDIDDHSLEIAIMDAQDMDIQPLIGTRLYLSLNTKVKAGSVTGVYKTLLEEYINPALYKFALYRSYKFLYSKIKRSGVVQQDTPNLASVDEKIIEKLERTIHSEAEFYADKLKKYLDDEILNIPEYLDYNPSGLNVYNEPDQEYDKYFAGIQLGRGCECGWKEFRHLL